MELDQAEGFDEELRKKLNEHLAYLSLPDVVGALAYAIHEAYDDESFVLMLAGALEGQRMLRERSIHRN